MSKSKWNDQLIKCKDTGLYLLLYIPTNHEKRERCFWEIIWGKYGETSTTILGADWYYNEEKIKYSNGES